MKKVALTAVLAASLGVSACATNPYGYNDPYYGSGNNAKNQSLAHVFGCHSRVGTPMTEDSHKSSKGAAAHYIAGATICRALQLFSADGSRRRWGFPEADDPGHVHGLGRLSTVTRSSIVSRVADAHIWCVNCSVQVLGVDTKKCGMGTLLVAPNIVPIWVNPQPVPL